MRGVTAIFLGAILLAFFLVLVSAMVWQEARRRPTNEAPVYALNEATKYVWSRLPDGLSALLTSDDVLRILEWQVHLLQQSVRGVDRGQATVVVGSTPEAVAFIRERTKSVQGRSYRAEHIEAVLNQQGAYLSAIGAVGEPVGLSEEGI